MPITFITQLTKYNINICTNIINSNNMYDTVNNIKNEYNIICDSIDVSNSTFI